MPDKMYDVVVEVKEKDGQVSKVSYHECKSFPEAAAKGRRIINKHLEDGWAENTSVSDVDSRVRLVKEEVPQTVEVWLRPTL